MTKEIPNTYQKTNPKQIEQGKALYLEGKTLSEISKATGVNRNTLKYYVKKDWKPERDAMESELVSAMSQNRRIDLVEITSYGLTFLKNTLKKLTQESYVNPTPGLLKTISTIVLEINKIKALDEGKPTEILETLTPSSTADVIELLKKDPFLTVEDSYENVEEISDTDPVPASNSTDESDSNS